MCVFVNVVCFHVEVSATGRPLVQRSPTECGVSKCELETSTMGDLGPLGLTSDKKKVHRHLISHVLCLYSKF